jgi:hypothetical protein
MKRKVREPIKGSEMLKELLLFFIPLGVYSMIMMTSHSVMNSGVSRALNPEIGLAAFAVTMNIMNMFASPCFTSRQMLVALAHDKKSLKITRNVMLKLTGFSFIMLAIIALTPVREFVFIRLFNTPLNLMDNVKAAAIITLSLPFIYSLRSYAQGILIVEKKTQFLTYTVVIRIIYMAIMAFVLPTFSNLSGATIGILIWTSGMGVEAVINYIFSRGVYNNLAETPDLDHGEQELNTKTALSFIWPLLVMTFIWTLAVPLINTGLAYTNDPELSLATFQVSRNFAWIMMAFLENNMRQVSLIFGTSLDRINYLKRFTFGISGILVVILAILALTPVGTWLLLNIIGVSPAIAAASKPVLIVLIFVPLLIAWIEYYMGLLMRLNSTKSLSVAKTLNLILASGSVIGLSIIFPQLGAMVGAVGLLLGYGVEMLYLKYSLSKLTNQ